MFKYFYRYILFLVIIFCSIFSAYSQHLDKRSTYPFKASISVQGSSVYLSDYANEFSCPVSIYLTCLDPSITRISVRLQIGIKAGGFTCQTTPYASVSPIDISFGQTYHLTDAEVAEYFLPQNISHSGLVNGRMPESLADFTVQVLEYNTGVKLSSVAYTMRPLRLLSPVRLISPQDKTKFTEDRANNILFTWSSSTPPNATDQVEYEFILKELTDTISSVQSAFNYAPIVYTETTSFTSLIYSLDKPILEVGKKYAWCVKTTVIPTDGVNSKQYIDNAGYSTVYSFEVSRPTPAPVNSQITKTEEEPYHNPHCGEAPIIDLSNKTPIESLKVGDTIMAGDFPIVLLEVTGSEGTFSGKGSVEIPWISRLLRFAVEFEGIGVNTDKRLISGQIEGVRNGTFDNIANLDAIDYGSTREVEKAVTSADISLGVALPNAPPPSIAYSPTSQLLTFYNETGAVVAETTLNNPQGKKVFPITVQDAEGNLYQVEETTNAEGTAEHTVTHVGKQGKELPYKSFGTNAIDGNVAIVTFEPTDSPYSFDEYLPYYKDIPLINKQNTLYPDLRYPYMGHEYYTPWQFIPLGEKVTLSAKIKINDKKAGIDPKKVLFSTEEGLSIAATYNEKEKTYTLNVPSAQSEGYYILHALYQTHDDFFYHLGQIGIDTRKPISARVVLVPMGGTYNKSAITSGINAISKQVGLSWQVEEYTEFEYSSELTANLFEKNSGVLFSYNDVQTILNSALKAHLGSKYDPSACYVFMLDKAPFKNDRNIIGFMPRGGKFGYIHCQGLSSESLAQILTHELMHGQFLLRHTFDDKYANGLKQGVNPTNLMDYKGGTHIAKWQWDQIYDPAITTSLIKYDEDGELYSNVDIKIFSNKEEIYEGDFVFINNKPEMPEIYVKPDISLKLNQPDSVTKIIPYLNWKQNIAVRAKIQYKKYNKYGELIRNDSITIPSTDWDSIKVNDIWHLDFKNKFCGGTVTVECMFNDSLISKTFYIRGINPSKEEILAYLKEKGYNEWYLPKMIMHESKMNQFNGGTDFKPDGFVGCPNWGYPNGYGLMQLDNFGENKDGTKIYATIHELWNWKSNVDRGVNFLREDKVKWARAKMRGYLAKARDDIGELDVPIIYYVANGINKGKQLKILQEGGNNVYEIFSIYPQENERDMADAITIKYYNGGLYCEFQKGGVNTVSKWLIYPYNPVNNVYYVKEVCSEIY